MAFRGWWWLFSFRSFFADGDTMTTAGFHRETASTAPSWPHGTKLNLGARKGGPLRGTPAGSMWLPSLQNKARKNRRHSFPALLLSNPLKVHSTRDSGIIAMDWLLAHPSPSILSLARDAGTWQEEAFHFLLFSLKCSLCGLDAGYLLKELIRQPDPPEPFLALYSQPPLPGTPKVGVGSDSW